MHFSKSDIVHCVSRHATTILFPRVRLSTHTSDNVDRQTHIQKDRQAPLNRSHEMEWSRGSTSDGLRQQQTASYEQVQTEFYDDKTARDDATHASLRSHVVGGVNMGLLQARVTGFVSDGNFNGGTDWVCSFVSCVRFDVATRSRVINSLCAKGTNTKIRTYPIRQHAH